MNKPFIIQIPATDFSSLPSSKPSPPPRRLLQQKQHDNHTHHPSTTNISITRQKLAAANRAASLRSTRARCRKHIAHVTSVVNSVRESRSRTQKQRTNALYDQLAKAATRRSLLRQTRNHHRQFFNSPTQSTSSTSDNQITFKSKGRQKPKQQQPSFHLSPVSPNPLNDATHAAASFSTKERGQQQMTPRKLNFDSDDENEETFQSNHHHEDVQSRSKFHAASAQEKQSAARSMATYFLVARAKALLRHVGLLGPPSHNVSFEVLADRIMSPPAVVAAHYILRAARITNRPLLKSSINPRDCRIFLSAFLLAVHPSVAASLSNPNGPSSPSSSTSSRAASYEHMGVVADARMLVFSLHLPTCQPSFIASNFDRWANSFKLWKEKDVKELTEPLIAEALELNAEQARMSRTFSAISDIANMGTRVSNSGSDNPVVQKEQEEWNNSVQKRQNEIRDILKRVAGVRGIQRLEKAMKREEEDRKSKYLHELLMDPNGMIKKLCDDVDKSKELGDEGRKKLKDQLVNNEYGMLNNRLAWIGRVLNGMRDNCFCLPVFHEDQISREYACQVVNEIFSGCHSCQSANKDGSLLHWRDESKRQIRLANNRMELADAITHVIEKGCDLVGCAYKDVIEYRIGMLVGSLNKEECYGIEREGYIERISDGIFDSGLPKSVEWIGRARSQFDRGNTEIEAGAGTGAGTGTGTGSGPGSRSGADMVQIVCHAIMMLVTQERACDKDTCAEILWMDMDRLRWMQNEFQKCCVSVSLNEVRKRFVSQSERGDSGTGTERLWSVCDRHDVKASDLQRCVMQSIEGETKTLSGNEKDAIGQVVARIGSGEGAVYKLIKKRLSGTLIGDRSHVRDVHGNVVYEQLQQMKLMIGAMAAHILSVHRQL